MMRNTKDCFNFKKKMKFDKTDDAQEVNMLQIKVHNK